MNRNVLALALALAFPTVATVVGFAGDAAADPLVRVVAPVPVVVAPIGPVVALPLPGPVYVGEGRDARWYRDHRGWDRRGWDHRGDRGRGRGRGGERGRGHAGRGGARGKR